MKILNLTQHAATPEQIDAGVEDVANRERLQALLTIPAADLARMTPDTQQAFLGDRVSQLIAEFVTPAVIAEAGALVASLANGYQTYEDDITSYNTLRAFPQIAAMIGGAPYLMPSLESALRTLGVRVCYALSDRVSTDTAYPDGTVKRRPSSGTSDSIGLGNHEYE